MKIKHETCLYVVDNNDLISREALKKHKFLTPQVKVIGGRHDGKMREQIIQAYQKGWNDCIDAIIDNAPSVEPEKAKESEIIKAYTKGFDTGVETVKDERPQGDIRWTDKLTVTSSGDIIDFEGMVVGHINLEEMKGGAE